MDSAREPHAAPPAVTPHTPATATATHPGGLESSRGSKGTHRPMLTPGQALFLARELYGIRTGPVRATVQCSSSTFGTHRVGDDGSGGGGGGGGDASSPAVTIGGGTAIMSGTTVLDAVCTELPSYNDRNFHIRTSGMQLAPQLPSYSRGHGGLTRDESQQEALRSLQERSAQLSKQLQPPPPQPTQQQRAQEASGVHRSDQGASIMVSGGEEEEAEEGEDKEAKEEVSVVLKVHNTQDNDRTSQLQAMDEAMLRVLAAGEGAAVAEVGGSSCSNNNSWNSSSSRDEVPYRVLPVSEQGEPFCAGVYFPGLFLSPTRGNAFAAQSTPASQSQFCVAGPTCRAPATPSRSRRTPQRAVRGRQSDMTHGSVDMQQDSGRSCGGRCHWHVVRCLSYVPGKMLSSVPYLTPALLLSLGRLMGRVTCGLAGWQPPALQQRCSHDWHPENGGAVLRRLVPGIQAFDQEQRSLLLRVADELLAASTRLSDPRVLPRQVCHADANDDNCVVSEDGREVIGIIDFGDMAIMPRVCEVAIAMLYAVLLGLKRPMGPPAPAGTPHTASTLEDAGPGAAATVATWDPQAAAGPGGDREEPGGCTLRRLLRVAGLVLCGYQRLVPLLPVELEVLPLLLRGRLAQSLALGAVSVVADPGNAQYLLATQRPGWRVIRLLAPGSVMTDKEMLQLMLMAGSMQTQ
ncbi:hypothetical protein VOLCADRAFT_98508 [Volvox carteri f. nagariensis]|uniref:Hydroxylysine kinase n=1 Tax=Volvox carteri f. nagariensis TaxID=3068 RepID=D8UFI8_VOLCA|nr:uncharacterized protein VOLCADRAFT_98508 [Volvox carteri f. nagariensis]EFJ41511.1 hypothetical protein VOLCADRAFT_98508 [Volvox carteri f. nagariensis]|eukprot:XP_002957456.1 hypothetical protein VOLCADRAFT_98508 [Volvox carteri f. nagariensis]